MNKRGQITIFIIIAIVIIASVGLYFAFRDKLNVGAYSPEVNRVKLFVEECLEDGGKEAVYEVSGNGGYRFKPDLSNNFGYPYYYINQKSYLPSKDFIEKELSSYLVGYLGNCVRDFENFPDMEIYKGEARIRTSINQEDVVFNIKYPLTITKANKTSRIEEWSDVKIYARLGIIYNSISQFMQEQEQDENLCLDCLMDIIESNDLYVEMQEQEDSIVFTFKDENTIINKNYLEFKFANKYG